MRETKAYPTILDSIKLLLIMLIAFYFSYLIVTLVENLYNISLDSNPYADLFMTIFSEGFIIFYGCKKSNLSYNDISIFKKISPSLLFPISISIIGLGIITSECNNIIQIFFTTNINYDADFQSTFDIKILFISSIIRSIIISPILEEILFRSIILRGFLENYSKSTAIVVSSLLFAIMHPHVGQAFEAFICGIFFAWLYIKTKSLLSSIFAHVVDNGIASIFTYVFNIQIKGYNLNSNMVEHQPLWFDFLGLTFAIIGFVILMKIFNKNNSKEKNSVK